MCAAVEYSSAPSTRSRPAQAASRSRRPCGSSDAGRDSGRPASASSDRVECLFGAPHDDGCLPRPRLPPLHLGGGHVAGAPLATVVVDAAARAERELDLEEKRAAAKADKEIGDAIAVQAGDDGAGGL